MRLSIYGMRHTGQNLLEFGGYLTFARFAPDGSAVAAYEGKKARLWDLKTGGGVDSV